MKSDYDTINIVEGKIGEFKFKTHKRFNKYYFNKDLGFENQSTHHVEALLEEGDTFIDVGAHHGYYSLVASRKVKDRGKIFAFEPVPENRELLKSNLAQINPKTYKIFSQAVSDKAGMAEFNIPWASDSAGLHKHPLAETLKTIEVKLSSLDELFSEKKVDFVKIDTEGNELAVLCGMKRVIENNPDIKLLVEFNPACLQLAETDPQDLLNKIDKLGFDIYIVDEENSATLKLIDIERWEDYLVTVNYRNLLCVRKTTPSVLLFAHTDALGGAELTTLEIASWLQSRGCIITVSIPGNGSLKKYSKSLNVATTQHRSDWWLNQPSFAKSGTQVELETSIEHYNYDTVLCQTIANPIIPMVAKRLQKKVIWFVHEDITRFKYPYSLEKVGRYIDSVADSIFLPSLFLKAKLEKSIPCFGRAEVVYPLPKTKSNLEPKHKNQSGNVNFVMIGRIEKNKNQIDAVKALSLISNDNFKPQLLIIGSSDRDYKNQLEKFIKENKLENQVKFLGELENPETFLISASALLSCSYNESFGRTIIQAMGAGVLTIVSKNGGHQDFVLDKKNALVYNAGDHKVLAKLLKESVEKDHNEIIDNARKSYALVEKTYEDQLSGLLTIIKNLNHTPANPIIDSLNHNYIEEMAQSRIRLEQEIESNQELKKQYDEIAKNYIDLIATHQNLLNSRAWKYSVKARKLAHPLRSRKKQ